MPQPDRKPHQPLDAKIPRVDPQPLDHLRLRQEPASGKYAPQIRKPAFSIEIPLKKIQKDF